MKATRDKKTGKLSVKVSPSKKFGRELRNSGWASNNLLSKENQVKGQEKLNEQYVQELKAKRQV